MSAETASTARARLRTTPGMRALQCLHHGDLFQPRCEVDGGPDAGEVEPVAAADIAIEYSADMQRHTEAKALQRLPDRVMHRFHTGAGFARGFQHARTNLMNLVLLLRDRKNREQ